MVVPIRDWSETVRVMGRRKKGCAMTHFVLDWLRHSPHIDEKLCWVVAHIKTRQNCYRVATIFAILRKFSPQSIMQTRYDQSLTSVMKWLPSGHTNISCEVIPVKATIPLSNRIVPMIRCPSSSLSSSYANCDSGQKPSAMGVEI